MKKPMKKLCLRVSAGLVLMGTSMVAPSFAAGPTLATAIGQFAAPIEAIPYKGVGDLGNLSLATSPLGNITLPVIGKGVPLLSTITVANGVVILQSISVLQQPLPGLAQLEAVASHY
jgi:hypothetical protein